MNLRSIQLHTLLLLAFLALAWSNYTKDDKDNKLGSSTGVILIDAQESETTALHFHSEERDLELIAEKDDRGRWFHGTETEHGREPTDDDSAEAMEVTETITTFLAGRAAESIWKNLEPVKASRILENVPEDKLEAFGLDSPSSTLTFTVRGKNHVFELGKEAYGSGNTYARAADGRVLLLPSSITRDLAGGHQRFLERRLLDTPRPEVEAVRLSAAGGEAVEFVQHNAREGSKAFWSRKGSDAADAELKAWANKLFTLQATSYTSEEPAPDWKEEARIVLLREGEVEDELVLWSTDNDEASWRARSGHTRMVAVLAPAKAEELTQDLADLLR